MVPIGGSRSVTWGLGVEPLSPPSKMPDVAEASVICGAISDLKARNPEVPRVFREVTYPSPQLYHNNPCG